jgi:hypothetical protein
MYLVPNIGYHAGRCAREPVLRELVRRMPLVQLIVALLDIHEVDIQGCRVILLRPSASL